MRSTIKNLNTDLGHLGVCFVYVEKIKTPGQEGTLVADDQMDQRLIPLVFEEGNSWQAVGLKGDESVTIRGLAVDLKPRQRMIADIVTADGTLKRVPLICRIDTLDELDYFRNGGILQYVLRQLAA